MDDRGPQASVASSVLLRSGASERLVSLRCDERRSSKAVARSELSRPPASRRKRQSRASRRHLVTVGGILAG